MLVKVVGIENVTFEIDDKQIAGQKLFYTYHNQKINGTATGSVFEKNGNRNIDDLIEVRWSRTFKKFYVKK